MTLSDLDRKTAAMAARRDGWEAKLLPAIRSRADDAHAHALKALTESLKRTADGRASVLRINKSPSFQAATTRLDELWAWLAGPSETSLRGKVRDAREDLYRLACERWHPLIPGEIRSRSGHEPTAAQVRAVRAAMPHGYDPRRFLEGPVASAKRSLKATLEQAGRASTPGHVEDDLLAAWGARTANAIGQAVRVLLSDSTEYADREAGRGLIHPDYLGGVDEEIPSGA